jgi:hypothetical protein
MVKVSNVTNSIMTNPLFGVVVALFILLIALAIIRMFQPDFSMGAEVGGHFGTLEGKVKLEAFENEMGEMGETTDEMESFMDCPEGQECTKCRVPK